MVSQLVKHLPVRLRDKRAKLEPGRPQEGHLVERPDKSFPRLLLLVPFLVDEAEKVAIQTVQVTLSVVLFQL